MSQVWVSIEWIFGDIMNFFRFLDFKKNVKVQLSTVGKMYTVCTILQNARCCLHAFTTTEYFGINPPEIQHYFISLMTINYIKWAHRRS